MNSYEGFALPTIFHRENIKASEIFLCCETVTTRSSHSEMAVRHHPQYLYKYV